MADIAGVRYDFDGEVDFADAEIDQGISYKVAAVHDGKILASTAFDIGASQDIETVSFKLEVVVPLPCGFRLILGRADVPTRVFLGSELARAMVSPRATIREQSRPARAHVQRATSLEPAPAADGTSRRYRPPSWRLSDDRASRYMRRF